MRQKILLIPQQPCQGLLGQVLQTPALSISSARGMPPGTATWESPAKHFEHSISKLYNRFLLLPLYQELSRQVLHSPVLQDKPLPVQV